ncbi:MAG: efflux RND transporter permease subunit [Arenicellales bacterium]
MSAWKTLRDVALRPVLWLLIYGGLIAYGTYALLHISVEVLPQFDYPQVAIVAHYPGATPEELETAITRPIEGQVLGIPNVGSVRAVMGGGTAEIDARFGAGTGVQQDLQAINAAIDRARGQLPPSADTHALIMGNAINEAADYIVRIPDNVPPTEVERIVRSDIVPALRALPGVQRVDVFGTGQEALWVQPDLTWMRRYGVTVSALVKAVRDQVLLRPAGYITLGHQDVLTEARHLPATAAELGAATVPGADGPIPLRDLARIVHAPVPTHGAVLLDGRPALALTVFKQPGASTVPVTQAVARTLSKLSSLLPAGATWVRTYSQGHLVSLIRNDLGRNLLVGALLAIAVLFWILGAGRGIWALAVSIPLSLLLGIAGLYAAHQSLNLMTLGALSVAVGLLVDDAIIVLESIYHRWERGEGHWDGIRHGVADIASPDISGTLSTVSVFAPLLFVGGLAGLFFAPFALAMGLSLLASLLISLSFIPLVLGFIRARPAAGQTAGLRALEWLRRQNTRLFDIIIRRPRLSLGLSALLLVVSLLGLALIPVSFLPLPNEGVVLESFTLPPGSSLDETRAVVARISRALDSDPAVRHTYARIGSPGSTTYTERSYAGEIEIVLQPSAGGSSLDEVAQHLENISKQEGVQLSIGTPTLERVGESLSGLPQPFVVRVFGGEIARLRSLSEEVVTRLRHLSAVSDVFNNDGYPVTQLQIQPRTRALAAHGLTPAAFYAQLQPLLVGEVLGEVPNGGYPLALYMRLADAPRKTLTGLEELPIRTQGWTPLGQLADLKLVTRPNQIRHIDGARALEITAVPLGPLGSTIAAARGALAGLSLPAGYRIDFGGLFPELEDAAVSLLIAAAAAFLLMIGILVLQFDGLLVPGLLLLQMPLAFTGGAIALLASGVGLNAIGLVGILTLIGISLNHGIVLLHRARRNEAAGMPVEEAVREAVGVRFRPILLTTLTAALGMLPTALGWGRGAAPEQGLAVVIMGGIIWSALLSTNLIPALYVYRRTRRAPPGEAE